MSTERHLEPGPGYEPDAPDVDGLTALSLFDGRLAAGAERPMFHTRAGTLSAAEVDRQSRGISAALAARGVGGGDRVAVMTQNDPQFPIVQLAAWRLGAITVPLSPMLRRREIERQLEDSGAMALVCLDELAEEALGAAGALNVEHVALTAADELNGCGGADVGASGAERLGDWAQSGDAPAEVPVAPDDTAVIVYTSGTSGRAKGTCISHANLVWSAHVFRDWVDLSEDTVILGAAPLFHVTGQVGHLALGDLLAAPVILDHRFDTEALMAAARAHGATFLVAAVTAFRALIDSGEPAPETFERLVGGAQIILPQLVSEVESWSGCYLQNIYGMTETTSPSHAVPPGTKAPVDPVTGALAVGVPVTSTESIVAAEGTGRRQPAGEPGELLIKGPQVVKGYWNRPDADAEAFREGWLHTGDLAVEDEDGWFFVLDRIKDLINVSGFKVSPREVEEVLLEHPQVREVAVVGVADRYRGETIQAYVVPVAGAEIEPDALEYHCRQRLAAYKCPRRYVAVESLPRTATGKVLRRRLRTG